MEIFKESLDKSYWDEVRVEEQYFKNQTNPVVKPSVDRGRTIGEFDVLAVNYDDKFALYTEIKTRPGDLSYAKEQVERAEKFFEDTEWTVIGRTILHRD